MNQQIRLCGVCRGPLPPEAKNRCSQACRSKASKRARAGKPIADPYTVEEGQAMLKRIAELEAEVARLEKPRRLVKDWQQEARSSTARLDTAQKRLEAKEAKITRLEGEIVATRRTARSARTDVRHAYKDVDKIRLRFSKYFPYVQAVKYLYQLNGLVSQYAKTYPELAKARKTQMPGLYKFLTTHREQFEAWSQTNFRPSSRDLLQDPQMVSPNPSSHPRTRS